MKILILVQSATAARYQELVDCQKKTWDSVAYPGIQVLYYYPGLSGDYGIKGSTVNVPGTEDWNYMFINFIRALREIIHLDWDLLLKTDNSAYINKPQLAKILADKPITGYYGGHLKHVTEPNLTQEFLWGEGFVISKDIAMYLIDQYAMAPTLRLGVDDIHVWNILKNKIKPDTSLTISEYYNLQGKISTSHIYRCANDSPTAKKFDDEITAMQSIHIQLNS